MNRPVTGFLIAGAAIVLAIVLVLAPRADDSPDGLESVASEEGFDREGKGHPLDDGPVADYQIRSIEDEGLSTGLAGLIGAALAGAIAVGSFTLIRRSGRRKDPPV